MKKNKELSDSLQQSLPEDQAVKYLNDMYYVAQEVLHGLKDNIESMQKEDSEEDASHLYEDVLGRLDQFLMSEYKDSIVKAGLSYEVVVHSARELSDEMKEKILQEVAAEFGSNYFVNYVVDESLLGGIRLEVGEAVFDTTFRSRLDQLVREV